MIVVPAAAVRSFRAAARKLGPPGRGPAPPVALAAAKGTLTLLSRSPDATLRLAVPINASTAAKLVVPFDLIARTEGDIAIEARGDTVVVRRGDGTEAVIVSRPTLSVEAPAEPAAWRPLPPGFAAAFHEAARTTARDPTRYALHRVQLRGKAGQLVASDAKQALVQQVALPFTEDLLVPATGVFGTADLARQTEWHVGRTADALAVAAGSWCVWLTVDATGRYPDVASIVTPAYGATMLTLNDADAARLRTALRDLPGADDATPVTLDLGDDVRVRTRGDDPPRTGEVVLRGASFDGCPLALAVCREHLSRAHALGFRQFRVRPHKPLVAMDDARTYLSAPLDADAIVRPVTDSSPLTPMEVLPMKPRLRTDPPDEAMPDEAGLWAEALALRDALAEAARRGMRLAHSLNAAYRQRYPLPPAPGCPALSAKEEAP